MDREECRFCQIVPNPSCPKLNGLSNQLIQYHYGEEFYFYFAKPINDVLRCGKNHEAILFREVCVALERPALHLKSYSKFQATGALRQRIAHKKHQYTAPMMANHESWKILHENQAADRGQRSTEAGQSRRRRPAGLYPLRKGSLFGKLLPTEVCPGQKVPCDYQFADVGGSFCSRIFDIYSPSYSSEADHKDALNGERKSSVFLDNRYESQGKPRVPLLDIKKLVKNKSTGQLTKNSAEGHLVGLSKGNLHGSTQNYSTQLSLEASRSRLLVPYLRTEENLNKRSRKLTKTMSTSKKKSAKPSEEKTAKKPAKKDEHKIKLSINFKGLNPLEKIRSPKTIRGWSDFFQAKKSVGQILKSFRQKRSETKPSLIGIEMLSSRTTKEKAKKSILHARDSFTRKSMVVNYSSPRVHGSSARQAKQSFRTDSQSKPTLLLVKEQLAKLSGKESSTKFMSSKTLGTLRSNSKKKSDPSSIGMVASPSLKLEKNTPLVMSHRMMPSMRLLKSSEEFKLEMEKSPKTQRLQHPSKNSVNRSASKSTGRKVYPPAKKKSGSKEKADNCELFGRNFRKSGRKKPLLIAVNN
jgi:hypothetical protein